MTSDKNQLYITISDKRGGGTPAPTPQTAKEQSESDSLFGRYVEHQMFHIARQQVSNFVNFQLSNIGNFTGDYIAQKDVNEAKQILQGIEGIAMSTLAGAKFGWQGAIVGFAVGVISQGANAVMTNITNKKEVAQMNYNIEQLRARSGLNTLLDGSRGTEN